MGKLRGLLDAAASVVQERIKANLELEETEKTRRNLMGFVENSPCGGLMSLPSPIQLSPSLLDVDFV